MRATAEGVLGGPGTPYERIEAYVLREQGQFASSLDAGEIAAAVLARASGSPAAFDAGVRGPLALLTQGLEPDRASRMD